MISTGIKGLDSVLTGLKMGDNVVWQIDDITDYSGLVKPFVKKALEEKKKVVYIRFASHGEILEPSKAVKRYELNAYEGFESFTTRVNDIITAEGEYAYYVFDCLSELLAAWASDLMIGNFFMVTCPYLYELKTVTYFSILRNSHSFKSIARIRETTQLLVDVYHCGESLYIHPLKVWNRYSPTMFLPHQKKGNRCVPITDSVNAVKILSYIRKRGEEPVRRALDYWDRLFLDAEALLKKGAAGKKIKDMVRKLSSIMVTKNPGIAELAERNFSLEELVDIKSRLVGTGFIGGKTVGMLLARKILSKSVPGWNGLSEPHDSFYVGSDIFYSYIVENKWWKLRMQQKTGDGYFSSAKILKEKMLYGSFSDDIMERFQEIIEYFGSSPIIIRSSSLLEDGFGNAFAGKYESIFLANQGTPEERYIKFAEAVKRIYSSTMSEDALVYRKQRGLDKADEQMALLVQRVSGAHHRDYFFPDLAGVGVSHNAYVWNKDMDPEAGCLRLVFGLGTRAVNRVEGDYPRMVALCDPARRPYADKDDLRKFSQHEVDVINTGENELETVPFEEIVAKKAYDNLDLVSVRDEEAERMMAGRLKEDKQYRILTLDGSLAGSGLAETFKKILKTLERSYRYPVEIEFTVNFTGEASFRINLLQCRPLQTWGSGRRVNIPEKIKTENVLFESKGYFLGGNISQEIRRIVYVDPAGYNRLGLSGKYEVARAVGKINREIGERGRVPTLLIGPGRWGTTTPSLGVPVKFAEINNVAFLAEVAFSDGNLIPELSYGTHFFQDLVETKIFYVALFPEKPGVILNRKWLKNAGPEKVVSVYDVSDFHVRIMADIMSQRVICFAERKKRAK